MSDELHYTREQLSTSSKTIAELKDRLWRQTAELDDIKTAAAVSEASKLDEIESERRRCQEEIATLQQLLNGQFLLLISDIIEFQMPLMFED